MRNAGKLERDNASRRRRMEDPIYRARVYAREFARASTKARWRRHNAEMSAQRALERAARFAAGNMHVPTGRVKMSAETKKKHISLKNKKQVALRRLFTKEQREAWNVRQRAYAAAYRQRQKQKLEI